MRPYLDLCQRVVDEGVWVTNERTGTRCKTVINADMEYDVTDGKIAIITTKKVAWKPAIMEMLGYLRGYTSAADFRKLGCNTWNKNANENEAWLNNPHRKGEDDMGHVYGYQARRWPKTDGGVVDQLKNVYEDLKRHYDNRGEIIYFNNPGEYHMGCLRACMHTHTFSVLEDRLYLTSYQRSDDLPLGHVFNQIQVCWFLMVMGQITGLKPTRAYHKIVNAHIYENQYDIMVNEQLPRGPIDCNPVLKINPDIKTLEDLETWVTIDDFEIENYEHHPAIAYPFSV